MAEGIAALFDLHGPVSPIDILIGGAIGIAGTALVKKQVLDRVFSDSTSTAAQAIAKFSPFALPALVGLAVAAVESRTGSEEGREERIERARGHAIGAVASSLVPLISAMAVAKLPGFHETVALNLGYGGIIVNEQPPRGLLSDYNGVILSEDPTLRAPRMLPPRLTNNARAVYLPKLDGGRRLRHPLLQLGLELRSVPPVADRVAVLVQRVGAILPMATPSIVSVSARRLVFVHTHAFFTSPAGTIAVPG